MPKRAVPEEKAPVAVPKVKKIPPAKGISHRGVCR